MNALNLLPWRKIQQELLLRNYCYLLIFSFLSAITITLLYAEISYAALKRMRVQGQLLGQELSKLNASVEQLKPVQNTYDKKLKELLIFQKTYLQQCMVMHIFAELQEILPPKMTVFHLQKKEELLFIEGYAKTAAAVAVFSERINGGLWLSNSQLEGMYNLVVKGRSVIKFKLRCLLRVKDEILS